MNNEPEICNQPGIYALHCPNSGNIRYVGRSKNIGARIKRHMRLSSKEKTHYGNWIRSLSCRPTASIIELTENTIEREIFWIAEMKKKGCDLVNTGDGGEGATSDPVQCLIRKMRNMFGGNEAIANACSDLKSQYLYGTKQQRDSIAEQAEKLWRMK